MMQRISDSLMTIYWMAMDALWMSGKINTATVVMCVALFFMYLNGFLLGKITRGEALSYMATVGWLQMNSFWMLDDIHHGENKAFKLGKYVFMCIGFIGVFGIAIIDFSRIAKIRRIK